MGKERSNFSMEMSMQAIFKKEKEMVLESTFIQMVMCMKGNGFLI